MSESNNPEESVSLRNEIIQSGELVYKKPELMNDVNMHYCPGCSHGVVHKLIAEVIAEMGMEDKTIGISPVGCAVFAYRLACIGTAETIHALNRGDNITIIFVNNAIYGMTGGQMAPTTLMGMKTATCPYGRQADIHGYPIKITEIAAQLEGTAYVSRQSVHNVAAIRKAKKAIRQAFENSMAGKGSNLIEIVGTCSSGWKMSPVKANEWMAQHMLDFYHVGDLKDACAQ